MNEKRVSIFKGNRKGFGSIVSTLIMFIAIVGISVGLVFMFQSYVSNTQHAMSTQTSITSNKLESAISISNIYYNSSSNLTYIYVKNIGELKLYPQKFDLFVDNFYETNFTAVYASNLSKEITLFNPQETMAIIYNKSLDSGTHTIKVVTEYSSYAEDSFNI